MGDVNFRLRIPLILVARPSVLVDDFKATKYWLLCFYLWRLLGALYVLLRGHLRRIIKD